MSEEVLLWRPIFPVVAGSATRINFTLNKYQRTPSVIKKNAERYIKFHQLRQVSLKLKVFNNYHHFDEGTTRYLDNFFCVQSIIAKIQFHAAWQP